MGHDSFTYDWLGGCGSQGYVAPTTNSSYTTLVCDILEVNSGITIDNANNEGFLFIYARQYVFVNGGTIKCQTKNPANNGGAGGAQNTAGSAGTVGRPGIIQRQEKDSNGDTYFEPSLTAGNGGAGAGTGATGGSGATQTNYYDNSEVWALLSHFLLNGLYWAAADLYREAIENSLYFGAQGPGGGGGGGGNDPGEVGGNGGRGGCGGGLLIISSPLIKIQAGGSINVNGENGQPGGNGAVNGGGGGGGGGAGGAGLVILLTPKLEDGFNRVDANAGSGGAGGTGHVNGQPGQGAPGGRGRVLHVNTSTGTVTVLP